METSATAPVLFPELAPAPAAVPVAPPAAGLFAQVVFNAPLEKPFTYLVPPDLEERAGVGKRVLAPFGKGNKAAVGFCVELTRHPPEQAVKGLLNFLDDSPLVTGPLLRLTRWMADYYLCGWGQVLHAVVPAGARSQAGTRQQTLVERVPAEELKTPTGALSPRQQQVLGVLEREGQPLEPVRLARLANCTAGVVQGLVKKGFLRKIVRRIESARQEPAPAPAADTPLVLNPDQLQALSAVEQALAQGGFRAFLLHGVTGSGKTEIYLQAIQRVVAQGREAIVLVPEISLTPQTIHRFRGRFPHVAVLHSHLSDADRGGHWRRIATGQVQVVVGARSAVFAPTRKLGLIIVDEEHEGSFKQEGVPRYHGRDVAVMRARLEGIPILLGSATPALESWHNVQKKQYQLLSLPGRVLDLPLPRVGLIDLRHEPPARGRYRALSPALERAMREALGAGGQVILLLNRRGYATCIFCPSCGHAVKCKFCDVSLILHRAEVRARCHYCGYEQAPPKVCPQCQSPKISYLGQGTEKLEAEIAHKFPGVSARRMDSDTMRKPGSHAEVLDAFKRGDVRILMGTQMIAKGLDFPNVTLVGVVDADIALHLPDFRAGERTFQLLAQVAGRTGRGLQGGKVLVQTFNPEHPCIALAARHDYPAFALEELKLRQAHSYPPFHRMARVIIRGRKHEPVAACAKMLAEAFQAGLRADAATRQPSAHLRLLGPAEAPLFRLKNFYRYHFQLQSANAQALHEVLRAVLGRARPPAGVDVAVDIDPLSML